MNKFIAKMFIDALGIKGIRAIIFDADLPLARLLRKYITIEQML